MEKVEKIINSGHFRGLGGKSQQFVVLRNVGISLGGKSQQFVVVLG